MSWETYDDECLGCKPILVDPVTFKPIYPDHHPVMQAVFKFWKTVGKEDKLIWHRVTCLNSRRPDDLKAMEILMEKMQAIIQGAERRTGGG
jgi:hypothetical protein